MILCSYSCTGKQMLSGSGLVSQKLALSELQVCKNLQLSEAIQYSNNLKFRQIFMYIFMYYFYILCEKLQSLSNLNKYSVSTFCQLPLFKQIEIQITVKTTIVRSKSLHYSLVNQLYRCLLLSRDYFEIMGRF